MVQPRPTVMATTTTFSTTAFATQDLLRRLAELERRVVEAEQRADEAEDKVRVMEQQLSEASVAGSNNGGSWSMNEENDKLCTLQSVVREKERVISRLECQVEEQRLLRLQESRQVEEKASKIKDWVSNKLRDLEEQNELLREQNQKCETQLELLRARLTQLNNLQSSKSKDRHSTEDSSRGSYEGDRPPSDESPPPDSGDGRGINSQQISSQRPLSATAACIAAIKRRSGAFDTPEERLQRRKSSNLSNSTTPGEHERVSRDLRSSRVDSGSVDMETPQSLSPRSPSNDLEALDNSRTSNPPPSSINMSNGISMSCQSTNSSTSQDAKSQRDVVSGSSTSVVSSSNLNHTPHILNNNNNVINIVSSPVMHVIPAPVPVSIPHPTPLCISHSPSPATPIEVVMVGGADSTQSLNNEPSTARRPPNVPPRKCRTRSPTPNTSIGSDNSDVTDSTLGESCAVSVCFSSSSNDSSSGGSSMAEGRQCEQAAGTVEGSMRIDLRFQLANLGVGQGASPGRSTPPNEEEDASLLRARLDAECQQLARDLQAAVRELVRPEQLGGLSLVDSKGHFTHHGNGLEIVLGTTGRRSHNSSSGAGSSKGSNHSTSGRVRALDENHDYSEIYTPSGDEKLPLTQAQPPPPPMHRFPSWESRIYEVAAGGINITSNMNTSNSEEIGSSAVPRHGHRSHHHSLGINFSIPVYTTVKGRASQIRSAPFSGDSTDSSDGEEIGSGSGSGPSHPISSGETDVSSPGKSVASSIPNSLSPHHRSSSSPSKSTRREPSFVESEISDDYAIPPDAYASETNSLDIALSSGCLSITPNVSQFSTVQSSGSSNTNLPIVINSVEGSPRKESLEKVGYLTKLGGKLKTWRKRWFVLKNGSLTYWKSPHDVHRRSSGREILLDDNCRVTRGEGAATFEIATEKKTYYLTADSPAAVDDWVRVLQNVVRRNATKLVLSMEGNKPTLQGWLVKVKNGHAKRCWCVLIGKMFLSFKSPSDTVASGQVNMKDARVEDVDRVSDSDNDEKDDECLANSGEKEMTIGIFPSHQSPIYLHLPTKQEKDSWLYHLTIVSGKGPSAGTQFEQLIHKLMEVNGDPSSNLWKNPLLLHSKESIVSPLTSLPSEVLQTEAVKLFKSCQLFMSVPLDSSGIDYHVALAQNALQLCLEHPELQAELLCALVKQTSRTLTFKNSPRTNRAFNKIKHSRFLLNATQSLFLCDSSSGQGKLHHGTNNVVQGSSLTSAAGNGSLGRVNNGHSSPSNSPVSKSPSRSNRSSPAKSSKSSKASSSSVPSSPLLSSGHSLRGMSPEVKSSSVRTFVFIQGWQLLSLAVSLFLPKNNKLLWYLKQHLLRNTETKTESGKYAAYCQRSIERTLSNGARLYKPSRMEVLSILMKNPFHHSLPHSVPVHYISGAYTVVGFDGSTTVEEFLISLCHEIGCREPSASGFALTEDDPFDKDMDHSLRPEEKICDVISQWETMLREKGSGRFETRRAVTLMFKSRIYRRSALLHETDKERLLLCYQTNQAVAAGKFPLTRELALELAALMAQIDGGDYKSEKGRGNSGQSAIQALEKYYPLRYRESCSHEESKALCDGLIEKWSFLKGKSTADCVRIYLTCTRKWNFFGATLFSVNVRGCYAIDDDVSVWVAICEDGIAILDSQSLQQIVKYSFTSVQTFGGALDDQFMVVVDDLGKKHRLLFGGMTKHKILEMTRLVADYINACCQHSIYGACSKLTRHNSLKSSRMQSHSTLPPMTPRMERKYPYGVTDIGNSSPRTARAVNAMQRNDSARRSPRT